MKEMKEAVVLKFPMKILLIKNVITVRESSMKKQLKDIFLYVPKE
jgi:hypothetical protein